MQTGNEAKVKNHFTTVVSVVVDWSLLHTDWLKHLSGAFDLTWVNGVKQENVSSTERAWKKKNLHVLPFIGVASCAPASPSWIKKKTGVRHDVKTSNWIIQTDVFQLSLPWRPALSELH